MVVYPTILSPCFRAHCDQGFRIFGDCGFSFANSLISPKTHKQQLQTHSRNRPRDLKGSSGYGLRKCVPEVHPPPTLPGWRRAPTASLPVRHSCAALDEEPRPKTRSRDRAADAILNPACPGHKGCAEVVVSAWVTARAVSSQQ